MAGYTFCGGVALAAVVGAGNAGSIEQVVVGQALGAPGIAAFEAALAKGF